MTNNWYASSFHARLMSAPSKPVSPTHTPDTLLPAMADEDVVEAGADDPLDVIEPDIEPDGDARSVSPLAVVTGIESAGNALAVTMV